MQCILEKKCLRQPGQTERPLHEVDGHDGKNFRRGLDAQEQSFLPTVKCGEWFRIGIGIGIGIGIAFVVVVLGQRRLRQWW